MAKVIYTKQETMAHFGISRYKLDKLVSEGLIPEPVRLKGQHPYWSARQISEGERRINERDNPKPLASAIKIRPLRANIKLKEPRGLFRQKLNNSDNK